MNKIELSYYNLLKKKSLYFSYIRNYIIFLIEKGNKNIIDENYEKNNNFKKKFLLLNKFNALSKKNFILKKKYVANFFKYKIYNNLNIFYIIKNNDSTKQAILNIKDLKENSISIINDEKTIKHISNKILIVNKNININDIYILNNIDSKINIFETYIDIKKKNKIKYNTIIINNNSKNIFINFYTKQKKKSNLIFKTINLKNSVNLNYYFFLIGKESCLKKKIFLNIDVFNNNKLYLNIYHYSNNSKSFSHLGAIVKKRGQIKFDGNIYVGNNIKNIIAHLKCDGITLTNNGFIEFNPNMFINNNDVICTHGANIGSIDKNIINYMLTRGLNKKNCKKILMKTFKKKFISKNTKLMIKKYNE